MQSSEKEPERNLPQPWVNGSTFYQRYVLIFRLSRSLAIELMLHTSNQPTTISMFQDIGAVQNVGISRLAENDTKAA